MGNGGRDYAIQKHSICDLKRSYIYGSLGFITGHELMHGFDSTGVFVDMHTNPGPWLSREFYTQFEERTTCLEKMYTDSKIPGFTGKVDGKITLNENIADNEGVKLAFKVSPTR
ncbi:hypothetical protein ANCCAN_20834 [Ancylostoma caninum]|uniref:Peptidase M13 C-terminal domain-containing protein n=1 Tax=Ancylostoma caninum TaxID=29170 RepID=A0A368FQP1_ANCCA|nr:hypothetical protein ANCCAN_20834 [Ancylostoma caninum]